ncbi:MAG: hypothetical protein COA85_01125 [Robiginitomaculum sp.]|nr:MAG: hypothetical protein COA85_01125 [Robiginitomaculum sp.]
MAQDSQTESDRDLLSSRAGTVAVLRGLDKISAETRDFEAPINTTVTFGTLGITVNYCRKTPPEEKPEVYVFMNIKDRRTDGSGKETDGEEIFSGWMFASNPALNALEHPIYDVWVLDCKG